MPLSREQSQIWDAMGIGPQWILRSAEDPLLPKSPLPSLPGRRHRRNEFRCRGSRLPSIRSPRRGLRSAAA